MNLIIGISDDFSVDNTTQNELDIGKERSIIDKNYPRKNYEFIKNLLDVTDKKVLEIFYSNEFIQYFVNLTSFKFDAIYISLFYDTLDHKSNDEKVIIDISFIALATIDEKDYEKFCVIEALKGTKRSDRENNGLYVITHLNIKGDSDAINKIIKSKFVAHYYKKSYVNNDEILSKYMVIYAVDSYKIKLFSAAFSEMPFYNLLQEKDK